MKSNWNLPPGVSVYDIPGNRLQDQPWDSYLDRVWELIAEYDVENQRLQDAIEGSIEESFRLRESVEKAAEAAVIVARDILEES
jgi:hypothetical protein